MSDNNGSIKSDNITTGRSWHIADEAADFAPWPDGDDYTWDDDALTPDEYTLVLEQKLQDATENIHRLRAELQTQRDGALVLAVLVGITTGVIGGFFGALIW